MELALKALSQVYMFCVRGFLWFRLSGACLGRACCVRRGACCNLLLLVRKSASSAKNAG